jgi:hypothetical protein
MRLRKFVCPFIVAMIIVGCVMLSAVHASMACYVTETGDKYHTINCHYVRHSCIKTTIGTAILDGKEGCSVCNP